MYDEPTMMLFAGNSNPALARAVATHMQLPLGKAAISRFSDGEVSVEIEENVRARDVFVLQSICQPTNDNLIEMLVLIDALRRASAANITAVIPYLGYARQDRRPRSARVPITAKVVANMIASVGTGRVLTLDLHADQIQGFFDMPMDNIYASPVLLGDIWKHEYPDLMVVSPDVGGVVRARAMARRLDNADLAIIDKRRPRANEAQVMNIIGDVAGRTCVLVDDMVDTAGTLCKAAMALKEHGARRVVAYCTHAVLSGAAIENLTASALDELVVTDTIPLTDSGRGCETIRQLAVAELIGESINRIESGESLSSMFVD
ncbi:MAG TPA: ribose-phosphate diphosphokinase [Gammaproteobacteria bacterium]|nr:ribose-phosphate diphosphokinase [Gammaproteobacteria bacterium]